MNEIVSSLYLISLYYYNEINRTCFKIKECTAEPNNKSWEC